MGVFNMKLCSHYTNIGSTKADPPKHCFGEIIKTEDFRAGDDFSRPAGRHAGRTVLQRNSRRRHSRSAQTSLIGEQKNGKL